jgi:hypothetical protein
MENFLESIEDDLFIMISCINLSLCHGVLCVRQGVPNFYKPHGHGSLHSALLPGKSRVKSPEILDFNSRKVSRDFRF